MAAFIAKQMIGSKLDSVKELAGDKKEGEEKTEGGGGAAEEDPEVAEARREEEERRRQKYAKMESEREKIRQGLRDKYKIKKHEEPQLPQITLDNSLNRQKKTPAQLAIDPHDDDFNPVKMATDFFGNVKTQVSTFKFPWS